MKKKTEIDNFFENETNGKTLGTDQMLHKNMEVYRIRCFGRPSISGLS